MKRAPPLPHRPARALRADLVDAAVLEVYGLVREEAWLADRALERVLRREQRLFAGERRAVAETVYGMLRAQGHLLWLLGAAEGEGEGGRSRRARPELATLYALFLARDGLSPEAAARRLGVAPRLLEQALSGVEARLAAIADPVERLAVESSLPRWIAALLVEELGLDPARELAAAMNLRAPLTVRANALKGDREALAARLAREGAPARATSFSPWGLTLDGHANAFSLASFQEGWFEIQDEGSQLIALAVGARPGQRVADACSGAGGKALALAAEMRGKGELWALDVDPDRLEEGKRRARRAGVHNLRTRVLPQDGAAAELALRELEGRCDRVLIDAPCSGLGTLRRRPDARWRLASGDPARFATLQRELLARFARLVKPGGRLVYATCSLGAAENREVAASAGEHGLSPLALRTALGEGLALALGADPGGNQLQLYPHRHATDGFFLAAFERASSGG